MLTDRTSELSAFITSLPPAPPTSNPAQSKASAISQLSQFHSLAGTVSLKISTTSTLLQRLSKLVQRKSLFNDPSLQINQLVTLIKDDLQSLNSSLTTCQEFLTASKLSMSSNPGSHDGPTAHTDAVIGQLKKDVLTASKTFKTALQKRSDNIKDMGERREMFGGAGGLAETTQQPLKLGGLNLGQPMTLGRPPTTEPMGLHQRTSPSKPIVGAATATQSQSSYYNNTASASAASANPIATFANGQYDKELSMLDQYTSNDPPAALTPYEMQLMDLEGGEEQAQLLIPNSNRYVQERTSETCERSEHIELTSETCTSERLVPLP